MITEAIILAGGKGSRLGLDIPKALVSINGKTLIQRQVRYLFSQGIKNIVLALGYDAYKIIDAVTCDPAMRARSHKGLQYSVEDSPLGTAGAIKQAMEKISADRFLVCNVDDLTDLHIQSASELGENVICLSNFRCPYGVVKTHGNDVLGFQEKPILPDTWVSMGYVILNRNSIKDLLPSKGSIEQEVYPNLYFKAYKHKGFWKPVNDKKQIQEADEYFKGVEK